MYRKLPFYPSRGEKTLDSDVVEITNERLRSGDKVKAKDALLKWRRMHTRANLNELKATLEKVNRKDVIQEVDKHLRPNIKQPVSKVLKRWNKLRAYNMITARLVMMPKIKGASNAAKANGTRMKLDQGVNKKIHLPSILISKTD